MAVDFDYLFNEKYSSETVDFETFTFGKIPNKRSRFKEIHALLLIEELLDLNNINIEDGFNNDSILVYSQSREDEGVYLNIDIEVLSKVITEEQVIELICCGVCLQEDSLFLGIL